MPAISLTTKLKQERYRIARQPLHTALVTRQFGKFGAQMAAGTPQVKTLELAEAQLMEQEGERHQLR
jgi:hypothetical protein